jgi:hypothetical protein
MGVASRRTALFAVFGGVLLTLLLCIQPVRAETLLKEDWAGYAEGALPGDPWVIWSGKPPGSVGKVEVVEQGSPFGGSYSVLMTGNVKDAAGPALKGKFTSTTTSPIIIKFDFYIPATPGAGVLPTLTLSDAENRGGLRLNMVNPFISPKHALKIAIQGTKLEEGDVIAPFTFDAWFHVEIKTSAGPDGRKTFDVMVTPFGKDTVGLKDLKFTSDIKNFSQIEFGWNSANPNGAIYLSNLVVETAL